MKIIFLFSIVFSLHIGIAKSEMRGVVGILEVGTEGTNHKLMFSKQYYDGKETWKSLKEVYEEDYWKDKKGKWTIAFDGKSLGNIKLNIPNEKTPRILNKGKLFGGWASLPEFRPLVLNSKPYYKDPEKWKPYKISKDERKKLYPLLRVSIGSVNAYKCEGYDNVPFNYGLKDMIVNKAYRSKNSSILVSVGINDKARRCEGANQKHHDKYWFYIKGDHVDSVGKDMDLVDAGDYDNDGNSEFIFWYSGYNKDGYILMYNNFKQEIRYTWGYH